VRNQPTETKIPFFGISSLNLGLLKDDPSAFTTIQSWDVRISEIAKLSSRRGCNVFFT
jgi:hypothetical protein